MSLLNALHATGLGACPLNWCVAHETDQQLREAFGIPDEEVVIALVAVGHLPETFAVAKASRLPVEDLMEVVGS